MSTRLIRPSTGERFEIRCDVGDAIVANLAANFVFFFERRFDVDALADAFAVALQRFPMFAGRMGLARGRMCIRHDARGVPFSRAQSGRTLREAVQATSAGEGQWLVDTVDGVTARWGLGPLCRVLVTHLADDATAIGFSWHHAIGDMHTLMIFMNAWAAAAAGIPSPEPVLVEDRAAYLAERLPEGGARTPGVRCLGSAELARSALDLAKDARKQRTLNVHFGDDELTRMRAAYGGRMRLSTNDVVCAHLAESLVDADPDVHRRTLMLAVNARKRCGLDPMLVGNVLTTLPLDVRSGESAQTIAERIRHAVDHFREEHCDLHVNQAFLDGVSAWRAARCVTAAFDPARWNPLVSNLSGFGVYRLRFEDTHPCHYTMVMKLPVAGLGVLTEGAGERGLDFQMSLPPKEFDVMSSASMQARLHRFREAAVDDLPDLGR